MHVIFFAGSPGCLQSCILEVECRRGGVPEPDGARGSVGGLSPDQHEAVAVREGGRASERARHGV